MNIDVMYPIEGLNTVAIKSLLGFRTTTQIIYNGVCVVCWWPWDVGTTDMCGYLGSLGSLAGSAMLYAIIVKDMSTICGRHKPCNKVATIHECPANNIIDK